MNNVLFSSKKEEWGTPQELFDKLNEQYHFTLDAAASEKNAKCEKFYDIKTNGLLQDWENETVWLNPPYGRIKTAQWVEKAANEAKKGTKIVMLIPARTDTRWFHKYIYGIAKVGFIKGRLKFVDCEDPGKEQDAAPFPSMLVYFNL